MALHKSVSMKFSLPGGAEAWKTATWVFLLSRFIIVVVTYLAFSRLPVNNPVQPDPHECLLNLGRCIQSWKVFDANHFLSIAHYGYGGNPDPEMYLKNPTYNPARPQETAFFPLFPLLIRLVGSIFGGSMTADFVAGMLVSNLCFFFALILLYHLVRNDFDDTVARNSLFFLAFSPFAVYFFLAYSESLFLLLCLGALSFLRRGRALDWWLAGLCGAGAILTRGTGIILLLVFFVVFLQLFWPAWRTWRERWPGMLNALLSMGLILVGLGAYMLYLWISFGDPLLFKEGEHLLWGRQLTGPWAGIVTTVQHLLFNTVSHNTAGESVYLRDARNLTDLFFTVLPIAVVTIGWKRLPLDYIVFSLAVAIFSLMYPWTSGHPLAGAPRFMLVLFPVAVMLAQWSKRPIVGKFFEVTSVTFFVLNTLLFVTWNWVA